jgi:hypothetical protein
VGPARMIAESLTPKPGIREQYRHKADIPACLLFVRFRGVKRTSASDCLPIAIYECTPQPHARCETGEIFKVPRSSAVEGG